MRTSSRKSEMIRLRLAVAILAAMTAPALAQTAPSGGAPGFQPMAPPVFQPMAPSSAPIAPSSGVTTSRGAGLVTGSPGSPQTVIIPGSPVNGMMMNNGNGTSSIMIPGSPSEVVPTPR
jgi:hypothetical protein